MKYVFLGLLAGFTAAHLYYSWKDEKKGRAVTKPFLLIMILLYYIVSAETVLLWLVFALVTSWLGDVLLIPQGTKWFISGGFSFFVSHFLFMAVYFTRIDFKAVPWIPTILLAAVYFAIAAKIIKMLHDTTPKEMRIAMYGYLIANSSMNAFAFMQMMTNMSAGSVVAYIGAVLFFISDCSLFLVRYYDKPVVFKKHFTVMLTYVLGEFLITQGVLMLVA